LHKALELAETSGSEKVEGYACTWLAWTCIELGLYDEAKAHGERAQRIASSYNSDQYLYFKSLGGLGLLHLMKGELQEGYAIARRLSKYGEENANSRSNVVGHWFMAMGNLMDNELTSAKKQSLLSIETSRDPFYLSFGRITLGWVALLSGDFDEAEEALQYLVDFGENRGEGQCLLYGYIFLGPVLAAKGKMDEGMRVLEKAHQLIVRNGRMTCHAFYEYAMGMVHAQIATGPRPGLSVMAKNVGFFVRNVPFAAKRAENHFKKAIELSKQLGSRYMQGSSCYDLGVFYRSRKQYALAGEMLEEAVTAFEQGGFQNMLKTAKAALSGLS
jgi:tetratricopeptide (TPR) repeat protein